MAGGTSDGRDDGGVVVCDQAARQGHGKARGRDETDRVLGAAHKLFDEIEDMLTEMRRELLGSSRRR